ncbi:MAG: hypothetical protein WC554_14500 [Clostridia bacterium]
MNFEKGVDPKDAMNIGDARQRKMNSVGMRPQDIEKMSKVKFFVEANSYETFKLWKENKYDYSEPCEWKEDTAGLVFTIGYVDNRPINLEFSFNTINGTLVCFYSGISQLVDHKMIEEFIEFCWPIKYDRNSRRAMTDATNFHNCAQYCKEEGQKMKLSKLKK